MFGFFKRKKPASQSSPLSAVTAAAAPPDSPGEARKARSIATLKSRGVPFIPHLPQLGDDSEFAAREPHEIFRRMRARTVYFFRSQYAMDNVPIAEFRAAFNSLNAWDDLSPEERACVESEQPTQRQLIDSSWAIESVKGLAWSLGLIDELSWPDSPCDVGQLVAVIKANPSADKLSVRPLSQLLDQTDLYYRIHWACRQLVQLEGKPAPGGLNPSVAVERRKALEWLITGPDGCDWDDVEMST